MAKLSIIYTTAILSLLAPPRQAYALAGEDRPGQGQPTDGLTGDEKSDFQNAMQMYSRGQYDALILKLAAFAKRYPNGSQLSQARNLSGLAYLATKRPMPAIQEFKKAIESGGNTAFNQFVAFNLAAAQFEANQVGDADKTLSDIQAGALDRDNGIKFHTLRSRVHLRLGRPADAARETLGVAKIVETRELRRALGGPLEQSLIAIQDPSTIETIYKDFEDSPMADLVLFRLAQAAHRAGQNQQAENAAKQLMQRFPDSIRYAEAQDLITSLKNQTVVAPNTIGVLLPLSGKFAKIGTRSLQAIQLAFRVFNLSEPDTKVTLVIQDSGESPEQAVRALNELYNKYHVSGVLGPLSSRGIDQVTKRAQELGLPMISLAQQPSSLSGDYVLQAGMTPQLQAREIARHAIEKLKFKRFAILYPRDKYGEQYSQAFWDSVESMGGEIVGVESYSPGETDFRQQIDKLSGLYYTGARAREVEALTKERREKNITKRTRKTEQFFGLPPVVDYDAVFIPDEPKVVGSVLPTFAYRDVDKVRFMGTAAWNSNTTGAGTPEIIARAQNHAEGAIFTDAFFPGSGSPVVKKFMARYKATYGQDPGGIEAIAYDAASVLERALVSDSTMSREKLRSKISETKDFAGVTGKITFKDGLLSRNLSILTVKSGQIVETK